MERMNIEYIPYYGFSRDSQTRTFKGADLLLMFPVNYPAKTVSVDSCTFK
jgi:hypothetical protein